MTLSSKKRIERFVDWFIRSDYVANWTAEKDSDFINEPKTHAEIIEDWREAFRNFIHYDIGYVKCPFRTRRNAFRSLDRFEDAVFDHFNAVEKWHDKNGSLWQEIG